jgi:hypothetical protein
VGSPDTFFEGKAGPYRLFVTVRMPEVIPGVAEVEIRSESNVTAIRILPLRLTGAGSEYEPKPELMDRSTNDPQFFSGRVWLMAFHAMQLRVEVEGGRGEGMLAVPLMAEAQRTLRMDRQLGSLLLVFMVFLAVSFVLILRVALGEARLEPGVASDSRSSAKLRWITAVGTVLVVTLLYLGNTWWNAEASGYSLRVMKPPIFRATVDPTGRLSLLPPEGQSPVHTGPLFGGRWLMWPEVLKNLRPDHGHLMHLFLVRLPGWDYFCHLHPETDPKGFFSQSLPNLPSGRYQMFSDVVTDTGLAITMVGQIDLPELTGTPLQGDDSTAAASSNVTSAGAHAVSALQDGRMKWEHDPGPLRARTALRLRFQVEDREGKPAVDLEPYMGMAGHLIVLRSDGSVFAHVHPSGSVAMASLELAEKTLASPAMQDMASMHRQPLSSEMAFPYGFPQPGDYRLFVQIKRKSQIQTGIFDSHVEP